MILSIVQNGSVLRQIDFNGESFIEAPPSGEYALRVYNDSHRRRMVVLSVDGINIVNGETAGFDGQGYVLNPWQTADIPGFLRDKNEVAAFTFKSDSESYAAQTGRGTSNVGVIGMAVFDEKVVVRAPTFTITSTSTSWINGGDITRGGPSPIYSNTTATYSSDISDSDFGVIGADVVAPASAACSYSCTDVNVVQESSRGFTKSSDSLGSMKRRMTKSSSEPVTKVGTAYGAKKQFHTTDTDFVKASSSPNLVKVFRYGTTSQLKSWGVPIEAPVSKPNAFPASRPSVPAPPGWQG